MTRTEKYGHNYSKKKNKKIVKKLNFKKIFRKVIQNIAYLIIGIVYTIYLLLKNINKLVIKLFNKLPKIIKVSVIYSLVAIALFGVLKPTKIQTIIQEKVIEVSKEVLEEEIPQDLEEIENQEIGFQLFENENANAIYNNAIGKGLSHEQAVLCVAISAHETGWWKSNAFVNVNNFGGIMKNSNTLRSYDSYENGLDHFTNVLKNYYFDLGLNTIEEIGKKYCPIGAANDPKGLNNYWVSGVTSIYNSLENGIK